MILRTGKLKTPIARNDVGGWFGPLVRRVGGEL
jgi:hypothetical protein